MTGTRCLDELRGVYCQACRRTPGVAEGIQTSVLLLAMGLFVFDDRESRVESPCGPRN